MKTYIRFSILYPDDIDILVLRNTLKRRFLREMRLCLLAEMNGEKYTIPGTIQLTDEKWASSEYLLFPIEEQEIIDYINSNKGELGAGLFLKNVMRKHYPKNFIKDLSLSLKSGENEYYLPLIKGEDKDIVSFFEKHPTEGITLSQSKGFLIIREKLPWSLPGNPFFSGACLKAYIRSHFGEKEYLFDLEADIFKASDKGPILDAAEETRDALKSEKHPAASAEDKDRQSSVGSTYLNDTVDPSEEKPVEKKDTEIKEKDESEHKVLLEDAVQETPDTEPGNNEEHSEKSGSKDEDDGFFNLLQGMIN